jgi:hypothetical protein
MRSNQSSTKKIKTDFLSLFLSWLRGVWGKLGRMVRRLFYPNRGRRAQMVAHTPDTKISPLMGVEKIRQPQALTVEDLMEQVEWRVPKEDRDNTPILEAPQATPASKGIPGFGESESLSVGNPKVSVQLTTPRPVAEEIPEPESKATVSSIRALYRDGRMPPPLVGTEQLPHRRSLTVGNLMTTVQWQSSQQSSQQTPQIGAIEDEINWD